MTVSGTGSSNSVPYYLQNAAFQALPLSEQEAIVDSAPSLDYLNNLYPAGNAPTLPSPSYLSNDSALFFSSSGSATLNFGLSLDALVTADQQLNNQRSLAASSEAQAIALLIASEETELATAQANSQTNVNTLQGHINTANGQTSDQQSAINTVNTGNSDQSQYNNVQSAQSTFISTITAAPINATMNSDGTYTIPPDESQQGITAYNAAVNTYNQKIGSFNSYIGSRAIDVSVYNTATSTYNSNVASNNTTFSQFLSQNGLTAEFAADGINLTQPTASTIPTDFYNTISEQGTISSGGTTISVASLPPSPPGAVSSIPTFNPTIPASLANDIVNNVYGASLNTIQNTINTSISYYAYLQAQSKTPSPTVNTTANPLLNTKPIAQKILRAAYVTSVAPVQTPLGVGATSFSIQSVGLSNPLIEGILGKANLEQTLTNFNLDLTQGQIQQVVQQLQLYQLGQVSANSQNALLPTLSALGNNITNLPPSSPAFGILFSLSFLNQILASTLPSSTQSGTSGTTTPSGTSSAQNTSTSQQSLANFLQSIPALSGLTSAQISQLSAAINLGQLLLSLNLLENNLGTPGLTAQLLLPLLSSPQANAVSTAASQTNTNNQNQLHNTLVNQFTSLGFQPPETNFLANTGVEISPFLLTPSPASVSANNTNQNVLNDSLTASLLLSNPSLSLNQAQTIATAALTGANASVAQQTNPVSNASFRSELANQLINVGVESSIATQAANEAVIVSSNSAIGSSPTFVSASSAAPSGNAEVNYSSTSAEGSQYVPPSNNNVPNPPSSNNVPPPGSAPSGTPPAGSTPSTSPTGTSTTSTSSSTSPHPIGSGTLINPIRQLNQREISQFLQNQITQLLFPQLGLEFSVLVTQRISNSLFGTPDPDSSDVADVKSPTSVVNVVKDQIHHGVRQQNAAYDEALVAALKNSIVTGPDLNTMLSNLTNPLYGLLYTANTGLMYSKPTNQMGVSQGFKQSIDIIV